MSWLDYADRDGGEFAYITHGSTTIDNSLIKQGGLSVDRYTASGSFLEFGNVSASELSLTLDNSDEWFDWEKGDEITVEIDRERQSTPTADNYKVGTFIIDSISKSLNTVKVVALDSMVKLDVDFDWNVQSYDITTLLNRVATICGITFNQDISSLPNYNLTVLRYECNCRTLVSNIAEAMGTCAYFNADNELTFAWYGASTITDFTEAVRVSSNVSENSYKVVDIAIGSPQDPRVELVKDGNEWKVTMRLLTSNPIVMQNSESSAFINNIKNNCYILNTSLHGMEAVTLPYPSVEPFQVFPYIDTTKSINYLVPITNRTYGLNQNMAIKSGFDPENLTVSSAFTDAGKAVVEELSENKKHFFFTTGSGAHVTEIANDYTHGNNILIDSDSVDIRQDEDVMVAIGTTVKIGKDGEAQLVIDNNSLHLYDSDEIAYLQVGDLRDGNGVATISGFASPYISPFSPVFMIMNIDVGVPIEELVELTLDGVEQDLTEFVVEGSTIRRADGGSMGGEWEYVITTRSDEAKLFWFGKSTDTPMGRYSVVEGKGRTLGAYSHAENRATAYGDYSHAENSATTHREDAHAEGSSDAYGARSHAEGEGTTLSEGWASHAEGQGTTNAPYAHAEGYMSNASYAWSHAGGEGTETNQTAQTVIGKWNTPVDGALVIGNGYSLTPYPPNPETVTRGNALVVGWDGSVTMGNTVVLKNPDTSARSTIVAEDGGRYGNQLLLIAGGNLIIGGGEYARNRHDLDLQGSGTENTYIGADESVFIEAGGQTIANRKTWEFRNDGNLYVPSNNTGKIYGVDTNGDNLLILDTKNSSGNTSLGYGNYANSDGNTNIYGNGVNIYTKTGVSIGGSGGEITLGGTDSTGNTYSVKAGDMVTKYAPTSDRQVRVGQSPSNDVVVRINGQRGDKGISANASQIGLYDYSTSSFTWKLIPPQVISNGGSLGRDTVSLSNNAWTSLGSVTLTTGLYWVELTATFDSNANGRRAINLAQSAGTGSAWGYRYSDNRNPVSGVTTTCRIGGCINVTAQSQTFYLNGFQNSGSALNVYPRASIIKIA